MTRTVRDYLRKWAATYRNYPAEDQDSVAAHRITASILAATAESDENRIRLAIEVLEGKLRIE